MFVRYPSLCCIHFSHLFVVIQACVYIACVHMHIDTNTNLLSMYVYACVCKITSDVRQRDGW